MIEDAQPSNTPASAWTASAAYLYLLQVSPEQLAWEYLRRNPRYRMACRGDENPERWGLKAFQDAQLDARQSHPRWCEARAAFSLVDSKDVQAEQFDLWKLAGRKLLALEEEDLELTVVRRTRTNYLRLSRRLAIDVPFGFVVPSRTDLETFFHDIRQFGAVYHGTAVPVLKRNRSKCPWRDRILHIQTLQTLDALEQNASHRRIGIALFGEGRVNGQWASESQLRAQVRYLIERGRDLCAGGYRRLLR